MEERSDMIYKIVTQRDNYVRLFNDILRTSKESYMILDVYYTLLNRKSMRLQISVIVMSSLLTCIQAGRSMDENYQNYQSDNENLFDNENIVNNTSFLDQINDTLSYNNMIYDIIVLSISTYSSLSLSIMRYFKWDDRREISSELKGKFLELHNRINYQLDILRPWNSEDYYDNFHLDTHSENWNVLIDDIEREYRMIIEVKKILVTDCDKLLTEKQRIRFQKKILKDEIYRNIQECELKEVSLTHKHDTIRIEEEIAEIDRRKRELEKNRGNKSTEESSRFINRFGPPKWDISRRISRVSSRFNSSNSPVNYDSEEDELKSDIKNDIVDIIKEDTELNKDTIIEIENEEIEEEPKEETEDETEDETEYKIEKETKSNIP